MNSIEDERSFSVYKSITRVEQYPEEGHVSFGDVVNNDSHGFSHNVNQFKCGLRQFVSSDQLQLKPSTHSPEYLIQQYQAQLEQIQKELADIKNGTTVAEVYPNISASKKFNFVSKIPPTNYNYKKQEVLTTNVTKPRSFKDEIIFEEKPKYYGNENRVKMGLIQDYNPTKINEVYAKKVLLTYFSNVNDLERNHKLIKVNLDDLAMKHIETHYPKLSDEQKKLAMSEIHFVLRGGQIKKTLNTGPCDLYVHSPFIVDEFDMCGNGGERCGIFIPQSETLLVSEKEFINPSYNWKDGIDDILPYLAGYTEYRMLPTITERERLTDDKRMQYSSPVLHRENPIILLHNSNTLFNKDDTSNALSNVDKDGYYMDEKSVLRYHDMAMNFKKKIPIGNSLTFELGLVPTYSEDLECSPYCELYKTVEEAMGFLKNKKFKVQVHMDLRLSFVLPEDYKKFM